MPFKKGHFINLGKKQSKNTKAKMAFKKLGIKNPMFGKTEDKFPKWKGDAIGYVGIHDWVRKWKGTPDICENCGKNGLKGHQIHWANVDHKYRRILDDYIRLCVKCHFDHDTEH